MGRFGRWDSKRHLVRSEGLLTSAKNGFRSFSGAIPVMRRVSPVDTHDAGREESMSLQLDNPSKCNAVVIEALPSAKSDPAFPVRGGNVGVTIVMFPPRFERLLSVLIVERNHEIQILATSTSDQSFAIGICLGHLYGVFKTVSPNVFSDASNSRE